MSDKRVTVRDHGGVVMMLRTHKLSTKYGPSSDLTRSDVRMRRETRVVL